MRRLLVVFTVIAGAAAARVPGARAQAPRLAGATADPSSEQAEARRLFEAGVELAQRKEFAAAARKFEGAFKLEPTLDALFAWAQAERLGGNCTAAVPLYREFLGKGPPPEHEQAAQIGLRRCAEAEEKGASPPPAPPLRSDAGQPPPSTGGTDWLGGSLVALGTVSVGAGLALVALSVNEDSAAASSTVYEEYLRHMERARLERTLGIGIGAAGAVLATIGVVRLLRPSRAEPPLAISVACGPARSLVLLRSSF